MNRYGYMGALALCFLAMSNAFAAKPAPKAPAKPLQPLEFKSLVLGEPTTPEQVIAALDVPCGGESGSCDQYQKKVHDDRAMTCGAGDEGMQTCKGYTSIVKVPAFAIVVIGADGRLQRVSLLMDATGYDDAIAALTQKFGPAAKVETSEVHNAYGASFNQEERTWEGTNTAQLYASRYGSTIEHSSIQFTTAADRDRPRKIKGANDL